MDWRFWFCVLAGLIQILNGVSGDREYRATNVQVELWEGEGTIFWAPPLGGPTDALYQVQQLRYTNYPQIWENVTNCELIQDTKCELGHVGSEPTYLYRVGLQSKDGVFSWSRSRRVNVRDSKLRAPTFSMSFPSSTKARVRVHKRSIRSDVFPSGLRYTVYLSSRGGENKTLEKIVPNDEDEVEFDHLELWQEYCIYLKVENIANVAFNTSSEQCFQTRPDMLLIISFVIVGVLGVMALLILAVCCFLRRPGKLPYALKSAASSWHPMMPGVVKVETVTDRGWFLSSGRMEGMGQISEARAGKAEDEKERRASMDSGVSVEPPPVSGNKGVAVQEDSGCGSLKEAEDGTMSGRETAELPLLADSDNSSHGNRREDSGLSMGNHEVPGSLEGEDSGLLTEVVAEFGDGYRSQSPSSVSVQISETEDNVSPHSCATDINLAAPSAGYRSGKVTCVCLPDEFCIWCQARKHYLTKNRHSANSELTEQCGQTAVDVGNPDPTISSYLKKNLQTVTMLDFEEMLSNRPQTDCHENSSLHLSLPSFAVEQESFTQNTGNLSLMLSDMELTFG
ncbi:interleukin-10 receptor subunit alpha [Chanos chanos]|uniref:Interleukin-10 receptor subunit alpha n=1 Tax=Chanos chanos TaxID=29144 RepID=A0A6J2VRL4_CHACN|nr:uncharacterized protein LOC115814984 [Chanos chanos]